MSASVRHVPCECRMNSLVAAVPYWLCGRLPTVVLAHHACPLRWQCAFIAIKADQYGGLSIFAVEKSMVPRGDQIPVIVFQPTAPPSRVNFREIRAPGVCKEKPRTGKQKLDTEGAEKRGIVRQ